MGDTTKIEWCDHTFNPWIGCQKVSRGCDLCYAEHLLDHRYHRVQWGPHGERKRTSPETWKGPSRWNARALKEGIRHRVFCASLSDWLDNQVPSEWRFDLCLLIERTPQLDWLLLTKRPENFRKLAPWAWVKIGCPNNVWFGVTAEDQRNFDHRWPIACTVNARVRFISYEPALGPLRLPPGELPDWIICGGESGPGARLMRAIWARRLLDQCHKLGVAFFLKQMTARAPIPDDLMVREFPRCRDRSVQSAVAVHPTDVGECAMHV